MGRWSHNLLETSVRVFGAQGQCWGFVRSHDLLHGRHGRRPNANALSKCVCVKLVCVGILTLWFSGWVVGVVVSLCNAAAFCTIALSLLCL